MNTSTTMRESWQSKKLPFSDDSSKKGSLIQLKEVASRSVIALMLFDNFC